MRDGIVSYEPGESWLASEATYTDFELRLEYRPGADSDSGIFMRSTPVGYPFVGRRLRATWNGEVVHDIDLDDPAYAAAQRGPLSHRATEGHIGFQAHATAPVEFRNLRIKNLK